MDKQHVLREIRRIAAANGGKAPGRLVFERETGIRQSEWYPDLWLRWSEALAEAGYTPNPLQARLGDSFLVEKYIGFVRELGRLPVAGEIRRKAKTDKSFPSHTVFGRFGGKGRLLDAVTSFCQATPGHDDVLELCERHALLHGG